MKLVPFEQNGLELVINTETGEAFASMSATARMAHCEVTQVRRLIGDTKSLKPFTISTLKGDREVNLLTEDQIFDVFAKYAPELLAQCAKAGIRVYLHTLAGYEVTSTAIAPATPQTYLEALKALVASEEEKERLKKEQALLSAENQGLIEETNRQAEIIDELFDYSSIIRIAKFNNCSEKAFSWRKLKAACTVLKLTIKKAPCPRFVTKNLYPHAAWRFVYPEYRYPDANDIEK